MSAALLRHPVNTIVRRQPGQVQPIVTQPTGGCGCRSIPGLDGASATSDGAPRGGNGAHSGDARPDGVPVTRASCLECIEKHVGAAYVLLTETRDGYAHRLRAIGHLHEAEDESQAWPDFHAAIRSARKAYQTNGAMPDWEALAQAAEAVRETGL